MQNVTQPTNQSSGSIWSGPKAEAAGATLVPQSLVSPALLTAVNVHENLSGPA